MRRGSSETEWMMKMTLMAQLRSHESLESMIRQIQNIHQETNLSTAMKHLFENTRVRLFYYFASCFAFLFQHTLFQIELEVDFKVKLSLALVKHYHFTFVDAGYVR
jgi:hypothetical protein